MASDKLWFYRVKKIKGDMPHKIFSENLPGNYRTVPENKAKSWEFRIGQQAMLLWTEERIEDAFRETFGKEPVSILRSQSWYTENNPDDWVMARFQDGEEKRLTRLETDIFAAMKSENVLVYEKYLVSVMERASQFTEVCGLIPIDTPLIGESLLSMADAFLSARKRMPYDETEIFIPIIALMRARNSLRGREEYIICSAE